MYIPRYTLATALMGCFPEIKSQLFNTLVLRYLLRPSLSKVRSKVDDKFESLSLTLLSCDSYVVTVQGIFQ